MPSTTFENLNLQKKELITNALLTEFSQHSLASAQVARIVKQAGIARGAFYKYFTDLTEAYQYLYQVAILEILCVCTFKQMKDCYVIIRSRKLRFIVLKNGV